MTKSQDDALFGYFQDGERWEHELLRSARRSRVVAWCVAGTFAVLTMMALTATVALLPLKSFDPYIVEVDRNTGYIEVKSGLTKPLDFTSLQAVTQANIVRYIRAREAYDPFAISENFGLAALLSTDDAARQLQSLYRAANPDNPVDRYGKDKSVAVSIKSVAFPNQSTSLVRFSTTETSETNSVTRHFISIVRYRYTETPIRNDWRFDNPLGFQVYQYRREQETVDAGETR
ncbi:type IV secretion system protein [Neorhizobium sp. NCHU2750]|uniref:virB8 family protein n=1 Tax=Neorhizobium sp. NCHU2750 TaxID=1825976 RepID=UPI000E72B6A2|nr:type IV secretion protein AvhB8 [Neorhizobium sp. NCHU2750]